MQVIELRERGIYRLPDQREFVICEAGDGSGYLLYSLSAWQRYGMPEYRAQVNGRILSKGFITRWRLEDLQDTSYTADCLQSLRAS
ncbi:MAG TPA: hypothetical protein VM095_13565 [Pyrinomonadaceae bacterium]|nr:hypothetical protein [Pyrinomonadaceae bacterium]